MTSASKLNRNLQPFYFDNKSYEKFARRADGVGNGAGENCFFIDWIDRMMKFLSQIQTVKDNGTYKLAPQALFPERNVQYMINRDQRNIFLEDAWICCEWCWEENKCLLSQPIKGIEVSCGVQSISETGKHYGIDDIAGWLMEYTRELAVYCESKAWTEKRSGQPKLTITGRWKELAFDFNYREYLPRNYNSKKNSKLR